MRYSMCETKRTFNYLFTCQQKLIRISQAIRILVIRLFNELYTSFGGVVRDKTEENKEGK